MVTLIIAEKPKASMRIASALSEGKPKKKRNGKAVWYEIRRDGKEIFVVPAVGHLFTLTQSGDGKWTYPVFESEWAPSFKVNKSSRFSKPYFKNFEKLRKKADEFIIATDFDSEGWVIGFNILRFICEKEDAKRMKFSTLTSGDLQDSYENISDLDTPQINSGIVRHKLDWLYGINASRALTLAVKRSNNFFKVLSTGRVQGPALKIVVMKEEKIQDFDPKPYWEIKADLKTEKGEKITAQHKGGKFWEKEKAKKIKKKCKDEKAKVSKVNKRKYRQNPPKPFDLTTLQTQAYSAFGFSPRQTLDLAQSLYDAGLISYPRTSSQKLPKEIGYKKIIKSLSKQNSYKKLAKKLLGRKLKPNEGKKKDQAHPSIFPTGEKPKKINSKERKLYDLVVKRFFAVFGKPAVRESVKITFDINGEKFLAKGKRTVKKNWINFYEKYVNYKEQILPDLKKGDSLDVIKIRLSEKETKPPRRYTQASLVKKLQKLGLGTKATRATIIKTLYNRGYIKGKKIKATKLGFAVVKTLEKYSPEILSEKLTKKFENKMEKVEEGKIKREKVVEDAKETLGEILDEFKKNEEKIGNGLHDAVVETRNRKYIVGECPKCGNNLRIIKSKKSGKRFIGCEGYKDGCRNSFPLPQHGKIQPTGKTCKKCGTPIVKIIRKKKRSFKMCIDPDCPSKDDWNNRKNKKKKNKKKKSKKKD